MQACTQVLGTTGILQAVTVAVASALTQLASHAEGAASMLSLDVPAQAGWSLAL